MGLLRRFASWIHMVMMGWMCWRACSFVLPSALHPGRSGAVAIHAWSSADHWSVMGY